MFTDSLDPERIEYRVESLLKQLVIGLVLVYEEFDDHDTLCHDVLFALYSLISGHPEPIDCVRLRIANSVTRRAESFFLLVRNASNEYEQILKHQNSLKVVSSDEQLLTRAAYYPQNISGQR